MEVIVIVINYFTLVMNNLTTSPVAQYCMQIKDKVSTSVKVVSTRTIIASVLLEKNKLVTQLS